MVPESLLGTIVGGIIGFGSSIGVLLIQRWITRPVISIDENSTEVGMNYRETDPGQVLRDEGEAAPELVEFIATHIYKSLVAMCVMWLFLLSGIMYYVYGKNRHNPS
jgi:hypothetical protein